MSERCERTSEQTSEWPSTPRVYPLAILLCTHFAKGQAVDDRPTEGEEGKRGHGVDDEENRDGDPLDEVNQHQE